MTGDPTPLVRNRALAAASSIHEQYEILATIPADELHAAKTRVEHRRDRVPHRIHLTSCVLIASLLEDAPLDAQQREFLLAGERTRRLLALAGWTTALGLSAAAAGLILSAAS